MSPHHRRLLTVAVLAAAGTAAVPRPAQVLNPPLGYTGGFGEPTCLQCHIGNDANAFGGRVTLEGLPERFQPGERYVLTALLRAEETTVAGYQLTARYAEGPDAGRSAGSLELVDDRSAIGDSLGIVYAHHAEPGVRATDPSGSSWAVSWTAPEATQPVAFHLTANSGNGDDSPLGDLVFTHSIVLEPGQ